MKSPLPAFFLVTSTFAALLGGRAGAQQTGIFPTGKQRTLLLNTEDSGRQVVATIGQQIEITLGTVGPGSYDEKPEISSSVIRFENVHFKMPPNPGGPTQVYVFRAAAEGKAGIQIPHINSAPASRPPFVVTIQVGPAAGISHTSPTPN